MPAPVLQFKRGNAGIAGTVPALRPGEPAISLNNFDFFIGIDTSVANNKFFGSHRYWEREDGTNSLQLKLVDKNGSNSINLKTPDTISGITTYTLPETPVNGYFLKTNSTGTLSWQEVVSNFDIAADSGTTDTVSTGSTITFTGGEGIDTTVSDNQITIAAEIASSINTGIASFSASYFSVTPGGDVTIGDAAADGSTKGIAAFNTDDFDAASGVISLGDSANGAVLAITGTDNEVNVSRTNGTVTVGLPDNVVIGAGLTVTGALDVNGGGTIDNIQIGVSGNNEIDTSTGNLTIDSAGGTTTIDDELIVSGDVRINGNDIKASDGNTNITLTSSTLTAFAGDIRVNGNDIQASNGNVNITMTSNTLTEVKGDLKVTGNDIQSSSATALTLAGANVTVAGDLTVGGSDIKAADGTTAITLVNTTGAVSTASDLTVGGNLYVNGNTTQVNTTSMTVEDRTIELGLVNGSAPSSATTWDLGVLFNYHATSAKKSAVVWEQGDARFKFASEVSDSGGTNNDSPQITFTAFAPIEIGALWVNDCAGQSQVISCTGTERFLENITIDAGTF